MIFPIKYDEPVFRPPSEASSLIIQITSGCMWNRCAFCEMYTSKKFRMKSDEEIERDIISVSAFAADIQKIFLADGDVLAVSTRKLLNVLGMIKKYLPRVRRISCYAKPKDAAQKSNEDLVLLKNAGLDLIYTGIESGDEAVLKFVNKDETYESTVRGMLNAQQAGIKQSVMIVTGLGGKRYSEQHARHSAQILNEIQPEFASTLVLSFPFGHEHFKKRFGAEYIDMSPLDLIEEQRIFIENTDLRQTVFRSDHASNYLVLKGTLSKDKQSILQKIDFALKNPEIAGLREEWMRGL